mmetsp:Transcript_8861/g.20686  ORF Transcript_8861/g.20686 Transcript_8861/m.20686 type:complete len:143 (-) Transcript_8861:123-551(-)
MGGGDAACTGPPPPPPASSPELSTCDHELLGASGCNFCARPTTSGTQLRVPDLGMARARPITRLISVSTRRRSANHRLQLSPRHRSGAVTVELLEHAPQQLLKFCEASESLRTSCHHQPPRRLLRQAAGGAARTKLVDVLAQ